MNFLAHIWLSGGDEPLTIGNFIADHVKGSQLQHLPVPVQNGIRLHRKIDAYTDQHPVVMQSKIRLRKRFGKYAPVVADVFYDHFLAANWSMFEKVNLETYSRNFYRLTENYSTLLPAKTITMLHYMKSQNWLTSYATIEGTGKALNGLSRRAVFYSGMESGGDELLTNYERYRNEFFIFFAELQNYTRRAIQNLNTGNG